ncbi:uncharacterized protein [Euphorbia lathyris]
MEKELHLFYFEAISRVAGCKEELMPQKERWLEALSVPKSSIRESRRRVSVGCKEERMPPKERWMEVPSVAKSSVRESRRSVPLGCKVKLMHHKEAPNATESSVKESRRSVPLGFNHGCIFCPPDQKFHPTNGYCVGRLPWYIPKRVFGPCPPR